LSKHGNIPIPMTVAAPPFTVQGANSNNIINALLGQPSQESRASIGLVESSVKNAHRKQVLQTNSSASVVGTGMAVAETPQFYEQRMMNGRNERRHLQPSIASQKSLENGISQPQLIQNNSSTGSYNNKTLLFANAVL